MRRQIALPAAFVLLVFATRLPAQQATFQSKIELVRVDAVVVDKAGNAVRGLTQKDFTLTDRKKSQAIATFEEVSHEHGTVGSEPAFPPTLKMDVACNTTSQADRLVMVVVDDLHIWKGRTDKTKDLVRDIITKLGSQASMALLFTSGEQSTQVTQDRSRLLAAVESMKARQSWRRPHQAKDDQKAAYVDPAAPVESKFAAVTDAQETSLQDFEENLQEFKTMQDAAAMLRSEDQRRKTFVLISEGLLMSMVGIFDASGNASEMLAADGPLKVYSYHAEALRDMMKSMWRSSVAMYAIDPRGKVRPEDMMLESWPPIQSAVCSAAGGSEDSQFRMFNPVRLAQEGLGKMAEASGGFAVTDTDDLTGGLDRIIEDIDHYYLLGFYPADTSGSDKYRPLGLTVPGHPDYTVRFRLGYVPAAASAPPKNKDPLVELAAGVMPKSDLPLRLTALPLIGKGKTSHVVVALEVSAPTGLMKDVDALLRDTVTYSILVVDDKKAKVTSRTGRAAQFSLKARDATKAMPDSVTYQIPLTLDLDPGRYQLRASAMSKKLDKGGSVYLDITVPDFSKTPLALSGIALGFADGSRVPVGRTTSDTPTPASARPQVPVADRLLFDPTLSREFADTDTLRAYFEVARADPASTVSLAITILDAGDHAMLTIDESVGPNESGQVEVHVPLSLVGSGAFRLRVTANDSHTVAQTETGIVVK